MNICCHRKENKVKLLVSIVVMLIVVLVATAHAQGPGPGQITGTQFNPAVTLILDPRFNTFDGGDDLELSGFQLGGEAGLPPQGFSTGHTELRIASNIDDKFYGSMTMPIVMHDGVAEIEFEEAFIETLALGNGFMLKGGRFFSGIGYLNAFHDHVHDFADRPLVYDAMFGGHLLDNGVQARWVAPTDLYLSVGGEFTAGSEFPGGENEGNDQGMALFANVGGDIGLSSSWFAGANYYRAKFDERVAGGHHHGGDDHGHDANNALLDGDVEVAGLDFVYKWAPNGNSRITNFKFQGEYFVKNEDAISEFTEHAHSAEANYDGQQQGFYVQGVYQFIQQWRVGVRYDHLQANNAITNFSGSGMDRAEFLEESGLGAEGDPTRSSIMVDYSPSHFSRIRLQYSQLDNGHDELNNMLTLQFTMSLGSHGAHIF